MEPSDYGGMEGSGSESEHRNRELRRGTERKDDREAQRKKEVRNANVSEERERKRCVRWNWGKWEMKGGRVEKKRAHVHGGDSIESTRTPGLTLALVIRTQKVL